MKAGDRPGLEVRLPDSKSIQKGAGRLIGYLSDYLEVIINEFSLEEFLSSNFTADL